MTILDVVHEREIGEALRNVMGEAAMADVRKALWFVLVRRIDDDEAAGGGK